MKTSLLKQQNKLALLTGIVCAGMSSAFAAPVLTEQAWQWRNTFCLQTCSAEQQQFFKQWKDSALQTGPAQFTHPMLDTCSGTTSLIPQTSKRAQVEQRLRRSLPPKPAPDTKMLHLPQLVTSVMVACQEQGNRNNIAQVLSLQPDRLLLLHENGVVLEFVPQAKESK